MSRREEPVDVTVHEASVAPTLEEAKRWLVARRERFVRGLMITAMPLLATLVAWVGNILIAIAHWRFVGWCLDRGELVPAKILQASASEGELAFLDAWSEQVPFLKRIFAFLGRLVPLVPLRVEFELHGRRYERVQFLFSDERVREDTPSGAWVLVDPRHPRLAAYVPTRVFARTQHHFDATAPE